MEAKDGATRKGREFQLKVQRRCKCKTFLLLVSELSWLLFKEGIDHIEEMKYGFASLCWLN